MTRALMIAVGMAASAAQAQLSPQWVAELPLGASLSAGGGGMAVDSAGAVYLTGTGGSSSNTDVKTACFNADGSQRWSVSYNGPGNWHDQSRGIALGPDGSVYVCGNTPGPGSYANMLVLKYDAQTGALLDEIIYSSGPMRSEAALAIAVDADGSVYAGGHTVGDGSDCLTVKFDAQGDYVWSRVFDGPAFAPYSQEAVRALRIGPDGQLVMMTDAVMASQHPDYKLVKYAVADGATIWEANWGVSGGDFPVDMELDAAGDIYVTGIGIDFIDKYSTVKFAGLDGQVLWQQYDAAGADHVATGLALDGQGGVYITGYEDPDGNRSNFNDNFFTVKRDAATGAFLWDHRYGDNCHRCYDVALDVAVGADGRVLVTGGTSSAPYSSDLILFALDPATGAELERGTAAGTATQTATGNRVLVSGPGLITVGASYEDFNSGAKITAALRYAPPALSCYANCDRSATAPVLNVQDFGCFLNAFASGDPYANCDGSVTPPALNVQDFACYLNRFAAGCP